MYLLVANSYLDSVSAARVGRATCVRASAIGPCRSWSGTVCHSTFRSICGCAVAAPAIPERRLQQLERLRPHAMQPGKASRFGCVRLFVRVMERGCMMTILRVDSTVDVSYIPNAMSRFKRNARGFTMRGWWTRVASAHTLIRCLTRRREVVAVAPTCVAAGKTSRS